MPKPIAVAIAEPDGEVRSLGTGQRLPHCESEAGQRGGCEDAPRPVTEIRPELPEALQGILERCLAKEMTARYASTIELRDSIDRLRMELSSPSQAATGREKGAHKSIAVLPFTNMSSDPENEFFADGLTEDIINALMQIDDLHVAARTSTFSFKGQSVDLRIVGERLNVNTVLEGSVRKAGDRLRITTRLINIADGNHLWAERYDREMKDIFDVQDEIARIIIDRLKISLTKQKDHKPLLKARTANIDAYQVYLKGRALLYERGTAIPRALECFKRAVGLDSEYALAWSGLADAYPACGLWFGTALCNVSGGKESGDTRGRTRSPAS